MTQQELTSVLVWVFSVGIPSAVFGIFKIYQRQQENRKNIAATQVQVAVTDEKVDNVKSDIRDEVLAEFLDAKRDLEKIVGGLQTEVTTLRDKVATLDQKLKDAEGENSKLRLAIEQQGEQYRQQLAAKDAELKDKAASIERLTDQLENARAEFVMQTKTHEGDMREMKAEMALVSATAKGYETVLQSLIDVKILNLNPPDLPKASGE